MSMAEYMYKLLYGRKMGGLAYRLPVNEWTNQEQELEYRRSCSVVQTAAVYSAPPRSIGTLSGWLGPPSDEPAPPPPVPHPPTLLQPLPSLPHDCSYSTPSTNESGEMLQCLDITASSEGYFPSRDPHVTDSTLSCHNGHIESERKQFEAFQELTGKCSEQSDRLQEVPEVRKLTRNNSAEDLERHVDGRISEELERQLIGQLNEQFLVPKEDAVSESPHYELQEKYSLTREFQMARDALYHGCQRQKTSMGTMEQPEHTRNYFEPNGSEQFEPICLQQKLENFTHSSPEAYSYSNHQQTIGGYDVTGTPYSGCCEGSGGLTGENLALGGYRRALFYTECGEENRCDSRYCCPYGTCCEESSPFGAVSSQFVTSPIHAPSSQQFMTSQNFAPAFVTSQPFMTSAAQGGLAGYETAAVVMTATMTMKASNIRGIYDQCALSEAVMCGKGGDQADVCLHEGGMAGGQDSSVLGHESDLLGRECFSQSMDGEEDSGVQYHATALSLSQNDVKYSTRHSAMTSQLSPPAVNQTPRQFNSIRGRGDGRSRGGHVRQFWSGSTQHNISERRGLNNGRCLAEGRGLNGCCVEGRGLEGRRGYEGRGVGLLCAVCGDNAACQHYGVRTCEGCKGFFKRTVQKCSKYVCLSGQNCPVDKRRRNRCQFCRFQKCLTVGMVREVVRTDSLKGRRGRLPSKPKQSPSSCSAECSPPSPPLGALAALLRATVDSSPDPARLVYSQCKALRADMEDCVQATPPTASTPPPASLQPHDVQFLYDVIASSSDVIDAWANRVPGFSGLCAEDRRTLLTGALMEIVVLRLAHRNGDETCDTITFCNGSVVDRQQCLPGFGRWLDAILELGRSLALAEISQTAVACLAALKLFTARSGLKDPGAVETLQSSVLDALRQHCAYQTSINLPAYQSASHPAYQAPASQLSALLGRLPQIEGVARQGLDRLALLASSQCLETTPNVVEQLLYAAGYRN